jgi:hypothetical protein
MQSTSEVQNIIERILSKQYDEKDILALQSALLYKIELQELREILLGRVKNSVLQIGNDNINIGNARDIQIGNNTYNHLDVKTIQEAIQKSISDGLLEGFKNLSPDEFNGSYAVKSSVIYRHLTAINEYPTLSFLEAVFPNKLKTILGIKNTPIIFTNNQILNQVQDFTIESGNTFLINSTFRSASGIHYCTNNNNYTKGGNYDRISKNTYRQEFQQSKEDFEKDTLSYKREDKNFIFAAVTARFQDGIEQTNWTSIMENTILQYPKLSQVRSLGRRDTWIKKIIDRNPNIRGFILFRYQHIKSFDETFGICGFNLEDAVYCIPPTPYLRFIDIKNEQNIPIKIESISFNKVEHKEYILTDVDRRKELLTDGNHWTERVDILLQPQHHLLIPIEFGFDTKSHQQGFKYYSQELPENLSSFLNKKIYIAKIPKESDLFYDFMKSLDSKNLSLLTLYRSCPEQINPLISDEFYMNQEFLAKLKSAKDLFNSMPKRFAVGSFMDVISLQVDGKDEKIDTPNDESKFSMSVYFAYGSCPYLLVYNSKKGYWIELGTVLTGKEQKSLQNVEIYHIGDNISKIKIEERDNEITYIESLSIIYDNSITGVEEEIIPSLIDLATREEEYFVLHQGQSMEISLENLIPINALNVKLKISGYYEILN